ncbi:hypothetical protein APHAL10511_004656 [Amanita phalloides]|nr:hypothetical protein APHAL10511_004656 [Amanita phalloides]
MLLVWNHHVDRELAAAKKMVARRPPPLQLKYDNFRLSVSSPAIIQRKKTFFQKLYRANWRKAVIAVAALNATRFYFSAANAFQDAIVDHVSHHDGLSQMSLIICLLYTIVAFMETSGVVFIFTCRLALARAYTYLAFVSALFVTAGGVLAAAIFFGFASEVISECTSLAMKGQLHLRSTFQGQPWPIKRLPHRKAYKLCLIAWSHESSFQAASLFLCTLLPTALCLILVYTYYRQVTDPTHQACLLSSMPGTGAVRMEGVTIGPRPVVGGGSYARVPNIAASTGVTSAREGPVQSAATQRRRGQGQGQGNAKEAKGLLQKQTRKSESFSASQKRKLAVQVVKPTLVAGASAERVQPLVMKSATSPYKMTPGPPSYNHTVEAYGPRLDAYSPGPN